MVEATKYKRVRKVKEEGESKEDVIKITARGKAATYVSYASKLFSEKELSAFTIKATGIALSTAVTVAEVIKRRFKGLHQITKVGTLELVDEWEPLEEGLEPLSSKRNVSFVEILLSKEQLDKNDIGYQEPLPESEVDEREDVAKKPERKGKGKKSKGKGKGKGKGKKGSKGKGKGKKGSKGKGKGKKGKGKKSKGKSEKKEEK